MSQSRASTPCDGDEGSATVIWPRAGSTRATTLAYCSLFVGLNSGAALAAFRSLVMKAEARAIADGDSGWQGSAEAGGEVAAAVAWASCACKYAASSADCPPSIVSSAC